MPLPQVNDRLKEIPAQALRTVFATIGQLLLVADRFRARAAGQVSGHGESTATRPAGQAPAEAPPVTPPAPRTAPDQQAESARWRSLDKTGNVRLLDGDEEQDGEDPAVPEPANLAPVGPAPAEVTTAEPVAAAGAALPVPNYDQLTVASLRARLRVLDAAGVRVLLDYEKAHEGRPAVITMFERRLTKLSEGS